MLFTLTSLKSCLCLLLRRIFLKHKPGHGLITSLMAFPSMWDPKSSIATEVLSQAVSSHVPEDKSFVSYYSAPAPSPRVYMSTHPHTRVSYKTGMSVGLKTHTKMILFLCSFSHTRPSGMPPSLPTSPSLPGYSHLLRLGSEIISFWNDSPVLPFYSGVSCLLRAPTELPFFPPTRTDHESRTLSVWSHHCSA